MVYLATFLRDPFDYSLSNGIHSFQKNNDSYCAICMESHSPMKISTRSFFAKENLVAALQYLDYCNSFLTHSLVSSATFLTMSHIFILFSTQYSRWSLDILNQSMPLFCSKLWNGKPFNTIVKIQML